MEPENGRYLLQVNDVDFIGVQMGFRGVNIRCSLLWCDYLYICPAGRYWFPIGPLGYTPFVGLHICKCNEYDEFFLCGHLNGADRVSYGECAHPIHDIHHWRWLIQIFEAFATASLKCHRRKSTKWIYRHHIYPYGVLVDYHNSWLYELSKQDERILI